MDKEILRFGYIEIEKKILPTEDFLLSAIVFKRM